MIESFDQILIKVKPNEMLSFLSLFYHRKSGSITTECMAIVAGILRIKYSIDHQANG